MSKIAKLEKRIASLRDDLNKSLKALAATKQQTKWKCKECGKTSQTGKTPLVELMRWNNEPYSERWEFDASIVFCPSCETHNFIDEKYADRFAATGTSIELRDYLGRPDANQLSVAKKELRQKGFLKEKDGVKRQTTLADALDFHANKAKL